MILATRVRRRKFKVQHGARRLLQAGKGCHVLQ